MQRYNGREVVADIWPFLPTMFGATEDDAESAWPHKRLRPNSFILVYFVWDGSEHDNDWIQLMKDALDHIHDAAKKQGCTTDDAPVYCNTSFADRGFTTPEKIYRDNLPELSRLRKVYDRYDVMGRTGGYRIPYLSGQNPPSEDSDESEHELVEE